MFGYLQEKLDYWPVGMYMDSWQEVIHTSFYPSRY